MSRVVTPPTTTTTPQGSSVQNVPQVRLPHDRIAMRAYEKWVKKGCPQGTSVQDWLEAETELRVEFTRGNSTTTGNVQQQRR
jgi:hypothetical protein